MNLNTLKIQYKCILGILFLFISCTDKGVIIEKEAKLKIEQKLKVAENTIKVLRQSSSGVNLNNENFDSLSRNVIRSLSLSAYEARKAYLVCEVCLDKRRKELAIKKSNSNSSIFEKHLQDSVYYSVLKQTILRIDSITLNRESDPTIQELLIEIEKLNVLKLEIDNLCQ